MHAIGWFLRAVVRPVLLQLYWMVRNLRCHHQVQAWNVGYRARIGRRAIVRRGAEIGSDVELGDYSYVSGPGSYIEAACIGKFCSIARQTVIGPGNHPLRHVTSHPFPHSPEFGGLVRQSRKMLQRPRPHIGNDVWIGIHAVVLRGVTIGDGAVIAACSVVTHDVEPYTIVAGNPARYVAHRFPPEIASAVRATQWWNWPEATLAARAGDFSDPQAFAVKYGGYGASSAAAIPAASEP